MKQKKLIRITTVPQSLRGLLRGQLRFMSNHYEVIGISSGGPILDEVARNEGVRVVPIEMSRTISPLKDLIAVFHLYKLFRREKPLIVHTHTPKAGTLGMLAAKLAGVPHRLHTVAGLPLLVVKGNKRKILDWVEKFTYSCATRVYPNSFGLYDIILKNKYTTANKLKVLAKGSSNGIDTNFFDPDLYSDETKAELKRSLNISPTDFVFIYVGRMVEDKGVNELVEAFQSVQQSVPNAKLLLVGNLNQVINPVSAKTLAEMDANQNIIAVGHQPDVRPYFSIADVLAFPSYREGFPNVVLQAGSMGVTSIVTDINGCNEIISDGVNGLIMPVKDAKALADKMLYLIQNPDLNLQMSQNSRDLIRANYERSFVWNEILKEYETIVGSQ